MAFYHFLVLGEEKRQYYLAQMLKKEGHEVMETMSYQPGYHDAILLPVPQTAMFFEENKEKFQKGQVVYGCKFPETAIDYAKKRGIRVVDYYKEDGVAERNALATAEGAVSEALIHGCVSIQGSECLVAGYGTCGAALAAKLSQWRASVTIMERKEKKRERAKSYGYRACSFDAPKDTMSKYDFIFNTVPAPVLTKERLQGVKPEVCIIDIASRPGGTDFSYCQESSIFAKLCLGLPGIYAPKSSAGILMEVIKKTILGD